MIIYNGDVIEINTVIKHNKQIAEENYAWGIIHNYTEKECEEYYNKAMQEIKEMKKYLQENEINEVFVEINPTTEAFKIKE